jgi:hypothetical protein
MGGESLLMKLNHRKGRGRNVFEDYDSGLERLDKI